MKTTGQSRWMLVDDEEEVSWLIEQMLGFSGRQIVRCNSGSEALRAVQADPQGFDLVITDFNMPRMNGDVLRQELRKLVPNLKIVLITANPDWNLVVALRRGFDGFLEKPFSIDAVRNLALALCPDSLKAA